MHKNAFEISKLQAAAAALGLGGLGGGIGFGIGRIKEKKSLGRQAAGFAAYNQEENQAIAEDAFNQGVEFAAAAIDKQSSLKGAVMSTLEKDAAAKEKFVAAKDAVAKTLKELYASGFVAEKGSAGRKTQIAKNILAGLGTIGAGTAAGVGVSKLSSLGINKEAGFKEKFEAAKAVIKELYASGFKAKNPVVGHGEGWAWANKRDKVEMAKNILAGLGTVAPVAAAGYGVSKLSALGIDKEAGVKEKFEAAKAALKQIYASGFSMPSGAAGRKTQIAKNILAGLGTVGAGTAAGVGVSKLSSLNKEAVIAEARKALSDIAHGPKAQAAADFANEMYVSGFKARKNTLDRISDPVIKNMLGDKGVAAAKAEYRKAIAKNLLAGGATMGGLSLAGKGAYDLATGK